MSPKNRPPTTPGEMLQEEFLRPLRMSQVELAGRMGVPVQRVNGLVNGKRAVTPETAILLGRAFKTSPQVWMHLQANYDLWVVERRMQKKSA